MQKDDGYNELDKEKEKWGIRRRIEHSLVPFNEVRVRICCPRKSRWGRAYTKTI